MKFIVTLFILKFVTQVFAKGPGTIFVYLISYQNPSGKTDKGTKCDSWFDRFLQDECDLVFSICLKNVENKSIKYPCNIGSISTLNNVYHNKLRVKFDSSIGYIPNPFNFTLRSMPINLQIRINITDDDISGQELISQMQHVIQLPIVGSHEDISSLNQIILTTMNSEIIFKVYGTCVKDYYGPGCSQYCKPSASRKTGFYACDRITGHKHCLIGWTGDDCKQRDLCLLENPCHGGAECSMNGTDVNCMCPNSLTGQFCQTSKRPCDSSPCVNGGLCVMDPNMSSKLSQRTICICPRNFTGRYCESDIDECVMYPCKNEAECMNIYGSYTCICTNNHWGINCEKPPVFSVKGFDSLYLIKGSSARFIQNMIIVLLVAVICLLCVIGLLSFLFYKNRSRIPRSESFKSVYSECHFDEKAANETATLDDNEIPYTNYYELENDHFISTENNTKDDLKVEMLKCLEKESVI